MGINLNKGVTDLRKDASDSLRKHGVEGKGVKVYGAFDHSGSMMGLYRGEPKSPMQHIAEAVLALGAELDDDGTVEAWFFEDDVSDTYEISLDTSGPDSYVGWMDRTHRQVPWGYTNYAAAIEQVAAYHTDHGSGLPGLCVFQTDGSPYTGRGNAKKDAEKALIKASRTPGSANLFFAFVGFGSRKTVDFLFKLDEIRGRARDNASAFVVEDFRTTSEGDLYDGVLGEFVNDFLPQVL